MYSLVLMRINLQDQKDIYLTMHDFYKNDFSTEVYNSILVAIFSVD